MLYSYNALKCHKKYWLWFSQPVTSMSWYVPLMAVKFDVAAIKCECEWVQKSVKLQAMKCECKIRTENKKVRAIMHFVMHAYYDTITQWTHLAGGKIEDWIKKLMKKHLQSMDDDFAHKCRTAKNESHHKKCMCGKSPNRMFILSRVFKFSLATP
jgi:hypothetical protein